MLPARYVGATPNREAALQFAGAARVTGADYARELRDVALQRELHEFDQDDGFALHGGAHLGQLGGLLLEVWRGTCYCHARRHCADSVPNDYSNGVSLFLLSIRCVKPLRSEVTPRWNRPSHW